MAGRGIKGSIAVCSTSLLLMLNILVLVGGIASIVILFLIEHTPPSRAGWLLIITGIVTVCSALIGLCSSTRRGCFTLQLVLMAFSIIGLLAASLTIFFKRSVVYNGLSPRILASTARKLLTLEGAVMFLTACVQVAIVILGICVNCCDLNDYYEDIEMTRTDNARQQVEADRRASRREDSKASQLAEQMKQKYGKWTDRGAAGAK